LSVIYLPERSGSFLSLESKAKSQSQVILKMSNVMLALPGPVVSKIRSSLNITSTASALRELVQNSLDAEASRIDCLIDPPAGYLKVSDDGKGISYEGLKMIGIRYSMRFPLLRYIQDTKMPTRNRLFA
jgi:hypothetical protein